MALDCEVLHQNQKLMDHSKEDFIVIEKRPSGLTLLFDLKLFPASMSAFRSAILHSAATVERLLDRLISEGLIRSLLFAVTKSN